jgi:hypothetical protein
VATTNALPRDDQGNDVAYENNLERLHAQADEETVVFNAIGLADLIEEQHASHAALVSRLNAMFIKHLEATWVPRTLQKLAAEKERIPFEHALLGMPPAHEEEALPQVRDAIVKEVEGILDRGVPSLLKEYSASILLPMKRDIQRVVQQVVHGTFRVKEVMCRFRHMCDSQILSLQQHDQILSWLPNPSTGKQVTLELLYRASRDGWQCQDFHSRCDNKGATVTVIKCTGGFVFGGYADVSWNSSSSYTPSPKAFLFSLHSPSGVGPVRLPLVQNLEQAIRCKASCGPTFGGGHDLHIADSANSNTGSYTNLGHTYQLPSGQSAKTFFTGGKNFQAAELEVYQGKWMEEGSQSVDRGHASVRTSGRANQRTGER